ncbi:MAG: DUF2087 domain-containing protein [Candidatus Eisenbacteria bacterium]|nr:DUF2087 domain-containing protein [Candidatus Eisenbacteria bacterium]
MNTPLREMKFLTAAEVASLLKLNQQVLVRKLLAGEIPAYKIGKDWRIEESELKAWLARCSNRRVDPVESAEEAIRRRFFEDGRLKRIPAQRSKRAVVLRILAESFRPDRRYTEAEVNEILTAFHPDFCTLRRELVMARLLDREKGATGAPPRPRRGRWHRRRRSRVPDEAREVQAPPFARVLDRVVRGRTISLGLGNLRSRERRVRPQSLPGLLEVGRLSLIHI